MCVVLIGLGVCFFTMHVCTLVKVFKTLMSSVFTFQDSNVFSLYISRLQCLQSLHFKTSMSSAFTFSRLQCLQSLHFETSMSSVFYISRLQCLQLLYARLRRHLFNTFDTSISLCSFYRFHFLGFC